ncbi:protein phosphatase 2C domain-containing protein [Paractinoplanes abujensis]|uniref:PPM-type phosphatase domain-containing protein n=1 Tax=Paractinoplanes abujensis TaxID=882441 RepID=A0A7W7G495_9ACTN|nr:hypothetical protein [Actinoplanes abujensis]
MLDGATARTDTGCQHGVSWYAAHLGAALSEGAHDVNQSLPHVLSMGIERVASLHPSCDLTHEGTPSAAVAIVRIAGDWAEYLVLGDVSVVFDDGNDPIVVSDERVSQTALVERRAADAHPIGTAKKQQAMIRMKHAELAMRNRHGGYWIAAADPSVAEHALIGRLPEASLRRFAVLTDGAARAISPFNEMEWRDLLDLAEAESPESVLRRVRAAEAADPYGIRWPRNKRSDDATIAFATK